MRNLLGLAGVVLVVAALACGTQRHEPTTAESTTTQRESADIGPFPTLVVKLTFPDRDPVYSAALYLFKGEIKADSPSQLEDNVQGADPLDEKLVLDHRESPTVEFTNVRPGTYTVCGSAIVGAMSDPETQKRIDAMGDSDGSEPMTCQTVTIVEQPERQDVALNLTPI